LCGVAIVLSAAAALTWLAAEPMTARSAATLLLATCLGLTAFTCVQCIPMPLSWMAHIAPATSDVWARSLAPLRESGPTWAPLSLDPTATRVEILKGVTYLIAFVTALRIARTREGAGLLSAALIVTGIALATAALLHPAFGAKRVFGVYEPDPGVEGRHIAPLLNPNHLAAYLNIAICLAVGSVLSGSAGRRPLPAAAAVFLCAVQVWIGSRGGVGAMVLGLVLVISLKKGESQRGKLTWNAVAGAAMLVAAAMISFGSSEAPGTELLDADASKVTTMLRALRMLVAYPLFGVGRGAFETTFPRFRVGSGYLTYTHPENVVTQWATEWGAPAALIAIISIFIALRPKTALTRSVPATGAWSALAAFAIQNLADFSTEVPGVMLAAVTCAAIVAGGSAGQAARARIGRWPTQCRTIAMGCVVAALATCALVWPGRESELQAQRRRLLEASLAPSVGRSEFHDLVRAAMASHPGEPYFPFTGALRAGRARDESALPWLGATLERSPVYGPAHLLLARAVALRNPAQARMEYRLALEQDPRLVDVIWRESPLLASSYDEAMELVPAGKEEAHMLNLLAMAFDARLPSTRERIDRELVSRAPTMPEGWARLTRDAVDDLKAGEAAPWCVGPGQADCLHIALTSASRLEAVDAGECTPVGFRAMALAATGSAQVAMADLDHAADRMRDRWVCLEILVDIAGQASDRTRMEEALRKLAHLQCGTDSACEDAIAFAAREFERSGSPRQALAAWERVRERSPGDATLLATVARLAAISGEHAKALGYYEQLVAQQPEENRWRRAAEAERNAAMRTVVDR
jgi:hypothetical protein